MSVAAAWARCKETVVARQTLITFVGLRDPYAHDPHEDGRHKGPILTLLDERSFDRVILLGRPHRADHSERTRQALKELHPKLSVQVIGLELADATHHPEILAKLRVVLARIRRDGPDDEWSVSLISGTPEMHACWVLLAVAGELGAKLLNFRRTVHNGIAGPRFVRELDWGEPLAALRPETLAKLESHRWPSNVSELRRVVEHAVLTAEEPEIQPEDLDFELAVNLANVFTAAVPRLREGFSMMDYLRAMKLELVRGALRKTGGNQSKAARLLGLTPQAVSQILRQTEARE